MGGDQNARLKDMKGVDGPPSCCSASQQTTKLKDYARIHQGEVGGERGEFLAPKETIKTYGHFSCETVGEKMKAIKTVSASFNERGQSAANLGMVSG